MQFSPCQLPSNDYAFTGFVYFNPADFEQIQKLGKARQISKESIIVKAGNFMIKAQPLDAIQTGFVGASSFLREMLQISKLDKVVVQLAVITDMNPINEVNLTVDYKLIKRHPDMLVEEDGMLLKLNETMISDLVIQSF